MVYAYLELWGLFWMSLRLHYYFNTTDCTVDISNEDYSHSFTNFGGKMSVCYASSGTLYIANTATIHKLYEGMIWNCVKCYVLTRSCSGS